MQWLFSLVWSESQVKKTKTNLFKERIKKFVALPMKKKQLRMIGKIMNLTFIKLFTVYIKIRTICFPYLLVNLFKERYISSVKSCKYLNKLISIKTMVLTFLKKTMYMCTIPLTKFQKKFHISQHRMPTVTYTCILSHACWKSPERAWMLQRG